LTTAPTLSCPHFDLPFELQTDASSVGLGAVLTQTIEGEERVLAYASRSLSEAERKYSVTEQECLAVVWAIQKFRPYLEGYRFTVVTDHSSLRWLHSLKNPTGRLARWALGLLEYDYQIVHRKGACHHVPDALSRMYEGQPDILTAVQDVPDNWYRRKVTEVSRDPARFPDWKLNDNFLYLHRPNPVVSAVVRDLSAWKLVLPKNRREQVLIESHTDPQSGHLGVDKTYRRLATDYFWPGMFRDTAKFVRRCETCQRCKVEQAAPAGFMAQRTVQQPWSLVAADIMGPFPPSRTGHTYLLVIQDLFTKWIECSPLRKATGKNIRQAFDDLIVSRWGTPQVLLTDNGTEFVNHTIREWAEEFNIHHTTTPPYHPQANPVERVNRVLKTMIVSFLERDHRDWDLHLPEFRFAYNTAYHSSLQTSPAFFEPWS
jgi:Integrase core domain.